MTHQSSGLKFTWTNRLTQIGWGLVLGLCLVACGGNLGNDKFRKGFGGIQGRLVFPDGTPAAQAKVQIVNLPHFHATTDEKGFFKLSDIPAGPREVVLSHKRPFASRISVWIVNGYTITLEHPHSTIFEVGQIVGRVSAQPRFGAKGIHIQIKGLPNATVTYNAEGDFLLENVPTGTHILQVSTPFFGRRETPEITVSASQRENLAEIKLPPLTPCKLTPTSSACEGHGICSEGFCVPDPGGVGELLQKTPLSFGTLHLEESRKLQRVVFYNTGPGLLRIKEVAIKADGGAFSLHSSNIYPLLLKKGAALSVSISFLAKELGTHQATLEIKTDGEKQPNHLIQLKGEVIPYPSNCLSTSPKELALGDLKGEQPHFFSVSVSNRCGQTLLIKDRKKSSSSKQDVCRHSWMGTFSMDVCLTLLQKLPIKIESGRTVKLHFQILPKGYGELRGTLRIPHDETSNGVLQLPVHARVQAKGIELFPSVLDFGSVAPDERRTLWLQVRSSVPITSKVLQDIRLEVNADSRSYFIPLSERIARQPTHAKVIYLPIQLKTPISGDSLNGTLSVHGLPGLQVPYIVPLRAVLASRTAVFGPTSLHLGATENCQPPEKPLFLTNPSEQPITLRDISWAAHYPNDFVLRKIPLPLVIKPHSKVPVAWIRFVPSSKVIRSYAQLRLKTEQENKQVTSLLFSLQASSGFRLYDTFEQPNQKNVDILLYIDSSFTSSADITALHREFSVLLKTLQSRKINFRILPLGTLEKQGGLSPFTPNPESELKHLLQPSKEMNHQGFSALRQLLLRRKNPANTTTVVVFVSHKDDHSPYTVSRYFTSVGKGTIPTVFAATASSLCNTTSARYREAVVNSGGAWMDICQASEKRWSQWGEQLRRFVIGQRKQFLLRQTPLSSSIQLATPLHQLTSGQWKFDQERSLVTLAEHELVPAGSSLTISYFTKCQ